jgi:HNH endonuclease
MTTGVLRALEFSMQLGRSERPDFGSKMSCYEVPMSKIPRPDLTQLSDEALLADFQDLVINEQEKLVLQLDHIVELDRRKLSAQYPSLRAFLLAEMNLEEWRAERLIRAARLLGRFPELREKLWTGALNLSLLELALGYGHREKLSEQDLWECFEAVSGKTCKSARQELARRYPAAEKDLPRDRVRPLTEDLSELHCVVRTSFLEILDDVRGILAHSHPGAKIGELLEVMGTEYRTRHHPEEKAMRAQARAQAKMVKEGAEKGPVENSSESRSEVTETPALTRVGSQTEARVISQSMAHELVLRDGYQCRFVDPVTGKRCESRQGLERDHIIAWADGGSTTLANARYLCILHHKRVSFMRFGECSKFFRPKKE